MLRGLIERESRHRMRLMSLHRIDDRMYERFAEYLRRWRPYDVAPVQRTMFHTRPTYFPNVDAAEIWYVDFVIGIPVPSDRIAEDIAEIWGLSRSDLTCVREDEAREITDTAKAALDDRSMEEERTGERPASLLGTLGGDYDEVERSESAAEYVGPDHNRRVLAALAAVRRESTGPRRVVDWEKFLDDVGFVPHPEGPREPVQSGDPRDFLGDDTPLRPVYPKDGTKGMDTETAERLSRWGNFWRPRPASRRYVDNEGRVEVIPVGPRR